MKFNRFGFVATTMMMMSNEIDKEGKQMIDEVVDDYIKPKNHVNTRTGKSRLDAKNVTSHLPDAPVPKGCKRYFFMEDGTFRNELEDKPFHWDTIASSDRKAISKFNKRKN